MHVIKEPKAVSFTKVGIKGKIFPVSKVAKKIGFCLIKTAKGHETKIIEHKCDFNYYILKGSGYFSINGQKEDCKQGDLVIIPSGSIFTYKGNLIMGLITAPPFYPEQEETLQ